MNEGIGKALNSLLSFNISIGNIPIWKLAVIGIILTLTLILKQIFAVVVIHRIERWTQRTNTTLDDELIAIIKPPLGWLIFLGGLWIVQLFISEYLNAEGKELVAKILSLSALAIVAYIVYRAAPLLGQLLGNLTLRTETELDDLIVPYIPQLFRVSAIVVVAIKASEIFLGASAGALIGLLGGAGVAFGLLFKDIVYDWCCTIIIYLDKLYKPGDWLILDGKEGWAQVLEIGLRSTRLRMSRWESIRRIPNSKMIDGGFENLSQNRDANERLGINVLLKIDGISSEATARLCDELREIPKSLELLYDNSLIFFSGFEGNARVIKVRVYSKSIKFFEPITEEFNLAILRLLEKEGIDPLQVQVMTGFERYKRNQEAVNN